MYKEDKRDKKLLQFERLERLNGVSVISCKCDVFQSFMSDQPYWSFQKQKRSTVHFFDVESTSFLQAAQKIHEELELTRKHLQANIVRGNDVNMVRKRINFLEERMRMLIQDTDVNSLLVSALMLTSNNLTVKTSAHDSPTALKTHLLLCMHLLTFCSYLGVLNCLRS